jgi:hypothetical protein
VLRRLGAGGSLYELIISVHLGQTGTKTTEVYLKHHSAREQAIANKARSGTQWAEKGTLSTATAA